MNSTITSETALLAGNMQADGNIQNDDEVVFATIKREIQSHE